MALVSLPLHASPLLASAPFSPFLALFGDFFCFFFFFFFLSRLNLNLNLATSTSPSPLRQPEPARVHRQYISGWCDLRRTRTCAVASRLTILDTKQDLQRGQQTTGKRRQATTSTLRPSTASSPSGVPSVSEPASIYILRRSLLVYV